MNKNSWQTNNLEEFELIAKQILDTFKKEGDSVVVGLIGNLGAGKTTFSKIIAHELGVANEVQSPTFTIMKIYETKNDQFKELVHIDAYRIDDLLEVQKLRINTFFEKPNTLTLIEWPENIKSALPEKTIFIEILHENDPLDEVSQKRRISVL